MSVSIRGREIRRLYRDHTEYTITRVVALPNVIVISAFAATSRDGSLVSQLMRAH